LKTRSEITIIVKRGDRTFTITETHDDEELPSYVELASSLNEMNTSIGRHLRALEPMPVMAYAKPPPF
jgi:hypothetical protein